MSQAYKQYESARAWPCRSEEQKHIFYKLSVGFTLNYVLMPIFVYMNKRDEWYETGKVVQQASHKSSQRCSAHIRAS